MDHIQPSSQYMDDLPHSQNWLDANKALWVYLSELLRKLERQMYVKATNFKYLQKLEGNYTNLL
jgi:hypothetical protein